MIVVRIELHSAVTGKKTLLNEMIVHNVGKTPGASGDVCDYKAVMLRKGSKEVADAKSWDDLSVSRSARVTGHARNSLPVQTLIRKALDALGY